MELIEQTETLLHLRLSQGGGYLLATAFFLFGLLGAALAWRKRRRSRQVARWVGSLGLFLFIPFSLYFGVRTTDVLFDKAKLQLAVTETTLLGTQARHELLALDQSSQATVDTFRWRTGGRGSRLKVQTGGRQLNLTEEFSGAPEVAAALAKQINGFLAARQ